jgi:hypothetical protein
MDTLELSAPEGEAHCEPGDPQGAITAEERAEWLIDYILLHQREERSQLLRTAVQQITAAEAQAYESGWRSRSASAFGQQ